MRIYFNNRREHGITLVVLVVSIIILLILAGVSLTAIFSGDGIFNRSEHAVAKSNKEQAREALEMVLADAKMIKYSEGLDEKKLNEKLNEIGQVDETDNTKIIVNGYIWEIDRNSLEILNSSGINDGIEINYTIAGNENWTKEFKNITINVTVKNNKGPLDVSSITVKKGETDITKDITIKEGNFTITTTESATYTISAKNSEGKESIPRIIKVDAKVDTTVPTVEKVIAEANGMNIKISAIGNDKNKESQEESGIDYFKYKITPTEGITAGEEQKTFKAGETVTITTTAETTYTIEITAMDKAGNGPSVAQTSEPLKTEFIFGALDNTKQIANDGEWWIPKGFIEATDSSQTIKGGKVIEDRYGNQFVWIPCYLEDNGKKVGQEMYENATEYKRTDFKIGTEFSKCSENLDIEDSKSIKKYGGFYIGRFETGRDNSKLVVKKGVYPNSDINPNTLNTLLNEYVQNVKYASDKMRTKIISSYVWDTTLCHIEVSTPNYATSAPQGWKPGTTIGNGIALTGETSPECNIYNLLDNVDEWTSEKHDGIYVRRRIALEGVFIAMRRS